MDVGGSGVTVPSSGDGLLFGLTRMHEGGDADGLALGLGRGGNLTATKKKVFGGCQIGFSKAIFASKCEPRLLLMRHF